MQTSSHWSTRAWQALSAAGLLSLSAPFTAGNLGAGEDAPAPVQILVQGDGQVEVVGGDGQNVQVLRGGQAQAARPAAEGPRAGRNDGKHRPAVGNPWAPDAGRANAVSVPDVFQMLVDIVNTWRTNRWEYTPAEQLPAPSAYGPGVPLLDLVAADDATAAAIAKLAAEADAQAVTQVTATAKKLDALYCQRLQSAGEMLSTEDRKVLASAIELWHGADAAVATVTETDPAKRQAAHRAARTAYFQKAIAAADPAVAPRLLAACANHQVDYHMPGELDRELSVYVGRARLDWNDLFGEPTPAVTATLARLTEEYWTAREAEHQALRAKLAALAADARDKMIAALPAGKEREGLEAIAAFLKKNGPAMLDLSAEISGYSNRFRYDPAGDPAERMKRWQEFNKVYTEKTAKLSQLNRDYGATWPAALRQKADGQAPQPWGVAAPGAAAGANTDGKPQPPKDDEF